MLMMMSSLMFTLYLSTQKKMPWLQPLLSLLIIIFFSFSLLNHPHLTPILTSPYFMYDSLMMMMNILTLTITFFMILSSTKIINNVKQNNLFSPLIFILMIILILAFSSSNFLSFYIMFESSLIPTIILILTWGYQPERLQAGMYMMMYTITASLPLLLSIFLIFKTYGTLQMYNYMNMSNYMIPHINFMWWMMMMFAFLVKLPMYFFHLWLPKAHVEAPVAGSMILAGLLLKLGGYGLLRFTMLMPKMMILINPTLNSIALLGGLITSLICLRQPDIKMLIAYSSIGHMSLIIMGTSLMTLWGWQATFTMMIAHGLTSSALFMLANNVYESTYTRSIFLTKGLIQISPTLSMWWFILNIANGGAPPSINLMAEISFVISAIKFSSMYYFMLGMMLFLTVSYSLFLYSSLNHGNSNNLFNPLNLNTTMMLNFLVTFHVIPIIIFILKPEMIFSSF